MSVNLEAAINFLRSKVGHVRYSMTGSRNFSDGTCDCSGAVYTALRQGGASNLGYIASTETLHAWLKANGFKLIAENHEWTMKRGDVVIWGKKGASAGAGGHTGICVDGQNWLECTAWKSLGETQQNHDTRWAMNGGPYFYVYRYAGTTPAATLTKAGAYSLAGKSLETLASDVQAGKVGSGDARKAALGGLYDAVQTIINERARVISATTSHQQLVNQVLAGKLGTGPVRKKLLGSYYAAVQAIVNKS